MTKLTKKLVISFKKYCTYLFSFYKDTHFVVLLLLSYVYFYASININNEMSLTATKMASSALNDFFFLHLPIFRVPWYFTFLYFGIGVKIISLCIPSRALFILFSTGTLLLLRASFVNLTHLGVPEFSIPLASNSTFGGDLFFSLPVSIFCLFAFIFWEKKIVRLVCILVAVAFGVASLLGRYDYSIDVFSAPFFTYGVYVLSERIFASKLFQIVEPYEK